MYDKQHWAKILFVIALVSSFSPWFGGIVKIDSALIISAVCFVGGLLLWYLPEEKK